MKKRLMAVAIVFLAASLIAMGKVKNGTFEGAGKGRNGTIFVETTFKNGKITEVKVVESEETPSFSQRAFSALIPKIVKENRVDLDTVAGASLSSKGLLEAVKKSIIEAGGDVKDFQKKKM